MKSRNWRRTAAATLLAVIVVLAWGGPVQAEPEEAVTGAGTENETSARSRPDLLGNQMPMNVKKRGLGMGLLDLIRLLEKDLQSAMAAGGSGDSGSGGDGSSSGGGPSGGGPSGGSGNSGGGGQPTSTQPNSSTPGKTGLSQNGNWWRWRNRHHRRDSFLRGMEELARAMHIAAKIDSRTAGRHGDRGLLAGVGRHLGREAAVRREVASLVRRAERSASGAVKHPKHDHLVKAKGSTTSGTTKHTTAATKKGAPGTGHTAHATVAKGKQKGSTAFSRQFKAGGPGGKGNANHSGPAPHRR
jgi:hypothetical protein